MDWEKVWENIGFHPSWIENGGYRTRKPVYRQESMDKTSARKTRK